MAIVSPLQCLLVVPPDLIQLGEPIQQFNTVGDQLLVDVGDIGLGLFQFPGIQQGLGHEFPGGRVIRIGI